MLAWLPNDLVCPCFIYPSQVGALDSAIRSANTAASRHGWAWRNTGTGIPPERILTALTASPSAVDANGGSPAPVSQLTDLLPFRVRRLVDSARVVREVRCAALIPDWDAVCVALMKLKSLPLGIAQVAGHEMELFGTYYPVSNRIVIVSYPTVFVFTFLKHRVLP